jgi:hypothetical protein
LAWQHHQPFLNGNFHHALLLLLLLLLPQLPMPRFLSK